MNILSVDTSGAAAGVAIFKNGVLVFETCLDHGMTHSVVLMPMIEQGLASVKMGLDAVDCFVCTRGPGSFTGVRIGVSTVKALAYAAGKSAMGVNTLDALAYNVVARKGHICAMMDARRAQVYAALYVSDGKRLARVGEYAALPVEECAAGWPAGEDVLLVGDGAIAYREAWQAAAGHAAIAPPHLMRQRAAAAGACALAALADGVRPEEPVALEPFYLRLPQAEREYRRRLKERG